MSVKVIHPTVFEEAVIERADGDRAALGCLFALPPNEAAEVEPNDVVTMAVGDVRPAALRIELSADGVAGLRSARLPEAVPYIVFGRGPTAVQIADSLGLPLDGDGEAFFCAIARFEWERDVRELERARRAPT